MRVGGQAQPAAEQSTKDRKPIESIANSAHASGRARIMTTTRRSVQHMRALGVTAIAAGIAGCGGAFQDDSNGAAARLTCPKTCTPSGSLTTEQIRPSYTIAGDGQRVQAQAGFSTGSDPRFNVELDGGDNLLLVTAQGTQTFHIPPTDLGTVVVSALWTLFLGAVPYVSEVTPSAAPMPVQFQFVRGAVVYASSVTLPAPYQIAAPTAGTTLPITTRSVAIRLTPSGAATSHSASMNCIDVNGNTASGGLPLSAVPGSQIVDANGTTYSLDLGPAIDGLTFTTTYPRGAVASCDVVMTVTKEAAGQPDGRFASPQIFAQQIRSVGLALR
jgi:hypothetical protein